MDRWGHQTQLAVQNFRISGEHMPVEIITAIAHVKQHAAMVNASLGVIEEAIARAIASAATEIRHGVHADQFPVDVFQTGSGTSSHMNVNEVIANRATEICGREVHPLDDVNASQSSNDVFPTAIRIAVLVTVEHLATPALARLARRLGLLATEHSGTVKAGRTHLMDAAPITFGQELGAWDRSIQMGIARFDQLVPRLAEMPLGGTAVGSGLNAPIGFAAEVIARLATDLDLPLVEAVDHFEAQACQEPLVEASGIARLIALSLFKIAGDIRLLSSGPVTGFGELVVPDLQAGSSIMPGKVNPVIAEVVQQVAAQVVGNDTAVTFAAAAGSTLQLNTTMPVMARNVLESLRLIAAAANSLVDNCFSELQVNVDRMAEFASRTPAIAAALNPTIGYEAAGQVARRAAAEGRTIAEIALRDYGVPAETAARMDPLFLARGG